MILLLFYTILTISQIVTNANYFGPISALSINYIHFHVFYSLFYTIVRIYLLSFRFWIIQKILHLSRMVHSPIIQKILYLSRMVHSPIIQLLLLLNKNDWITSWILYIRSNRTIIQQWNHLSFIMFILNLVLVIWFEVTSLVL